MKEKLLQCLFAEKSTLRCMYHGPCVYTDQTQHFLSAQFKTRSLQARSYPEWGYRKDSHIKPALSI